MYSLIRFHYFSRPWRKLFLVSGLMPWRPHFVIQFYANAYRFLLMFLFSQMACQTRDLKSLKALQIDLWSLFTAEQNHLLHLVIAELSQPSGLDS